MNIKIFFMLFLNFFLLNNACHATLGFYENNPIHQAIRKNDVQLVKDILKNSHSLESRGLFGRTPLALAVHLRNIKMVNILFLNHADPCAYDYFDRSVFHEALLNMRNIFDRKESMTIIKRLLEYKTSLVNLWGNAKGLARFFDIPLCFALDTNNLELFIILLESEAKLLNLIDYEINVIPSEYTLEIIDVDSLDEENLRNYSERIIPIEMETFRKMIRQMKKMNEIALADDRLDLHQRYLVDTAISNFRIKLKDAFERTLS